MRVKVWLPVTLAVAVAVLAGGWFALGRPGPSAAAAALGLSDTAAAKNNKPPPLPVKVARAVREQVPVTFDYTGTIISPKDAELQARVTGVVVKRPFEPGNVVTEGQLLFQIDTRPFEIALQSAEAQKAQAETNLSFAKSQVGRAKLLTKKGYETAQRTQQLSAQEATATATLQQAEASIAREKLNIEFATIRAPFDGRVSLSLINVGDTVIADTTKLASVVQIDPIDLQVALSAKDSEAVRQAMDKHDAEIAILDSNNEAVRDAKIYELDNRFDPSTARRLVRALVHNKDGRYLPGEFVRARVKVGTKERVLVPTIALSTQLDERIVYAVDGQKVRVVPVEAGEAHGDKTAVTKGLDAGATVAVDHLQRLNDGETIDPEPVSGGDAG